MIKLRDVVNELNSIPKPSRRRIEVIVKLVYLQGKEDQSCTYKAREENYNKLMEKYKKLLKIRGPQI